MKRRASLLLTAALLAGCATNPYTGRCSGEAFSCVLDYNLP